MATTAKDVVLSWGLINCIVNVEGAVKAEESLSTVCDGQGKHPPTKVHMKRHCATCASEVSYTDLKKAREVGKGNFVLVDQQEVADIRASVVGASTKALGITSSPAEEVFTTTLQGEKVYFLLPSNAAQLGPYSLILDGVMRHPEKAFMGIWTPRSRPAMFQLKAFQGKALTLEERVWPEKVRTTPGVDFIEPPQVLREQFDMVLENMTTPFDVTQFADTYKRKLDELVASKEVVAGISDEPTKAGPSMPTSVGSVDLSAALAAMLAGGSDAPDPAAKPARKPRKKAS